MKHTRKLLKNRIKSKAGFTLAETLLAVLIMLMVSAIVVAGIPAAKNAYEKVVLASNAEVLLSTTISTLRNELGMAQDVDTPDAVSGEQTSSVITYYNAGRGASSKIYVNSKQNENAEIMFQRYYSTDGLVKNSDTAPLILPETATGGLYVTYGSVDYDDTNKTVTFSNLSVNSPEKDGLASRNSLSIRVLSGSKDDTQ